MAAGAMVSAARAAGGYCWMGQVIESGDVVALGFERPLDPALVLLAAHLERHLDLGVAEA